MLVFMALLLVIAGIPATGHRRRRNHANEHTTTLPGTSLIEADTHCAGQANLQTNQTATSVALASSSFGEEPMQSQHEATFSWLTCVGYVVALTMQQRPSSTPSDCWTLSPLQNHLFRALMQCSVEATSLHATLDEVRRRIQLAGHTAENASALTSSLHRWFVTGSLPSEGGNHVGNLGDDGGQAQMSGTQPGNEG